MTVDKAALLARRLGEDEHEIEGFGSVRLRSLSRAEVLALQKLNDTAESDRRMVSLCLIGPFTLTEDEVGIWQENSPPMEIERLTVAIRDLSGMGPGAAKSGVPGVRE